MVNKPRKPVYLRQDQWQLVDALLAVASNTIAIDAQDKYERIRATSRQALHWSNAQLADIRTALKPVLQPRSSPP